MGASSIAEPDLDYMRGFHARTGAFARRYDRQLSSRFPRPTIAPAAGRLDDEHIVALHLDLEGCAIFLPPAPAPLDPVPADRARLAARGTERRHAPMLREHHGRHRLEESHTALSAVAAAMPSGTTAAAADAVLLEPHGEAPFEHLRVRQPRIGHVRLHDAGSVEIGPRAGSAGNCLVILVAGVAEGEVVHRALRSSEHSERAVQRIGDRL